MLELEGHKLLSRDAANAFLLRGKDLSLNELAYLAITELLMDDGTWLSVLTVATLYF